MADEKAEKKLTPPYIPYKTFKSYIEGLRSSGLPSVIDRSVLGNKSGGEQTALLGALRYLGLINDLGVPTDVLKAIKGSPAEKYADTYKELLRDRLTRSYRFLFAGDLKLDNATPKQLDDAFESTGAGSETVRKALAFFLYAARDAGIQLSPFLKAPRVVRARKPRQKMPAEKNGAPTERMQPDPKLPPQVERPMSQRLFELLDPQAMDEKEQAAVWTLMTYLKKHGKS